MLHFRSPIVNHLGTLFNFFPLHFGWKEETDKISVILFENFVDDSVSLTIPVRTGLLGNKISQKIHPLPRLQYQVKQLEAHP